MNFVQLNVEINLRYCCLSCKVNAQEAGEGKLEVVISGPQCQRVLSDVATDGNGAFLVSFIPSVSGLHRADVTYNDQTITGNIQDNFSTRTFKQTVHSLYMTSCRTNMLTSD